jgi:hypothetical protein
MPLPLQQLDVARSCLYAWSQRRIAASIGGKVSCEYRHCTIRNLSTIDYEQQLIKTRTLNAR